MSLRAEIHDALDEVTPPAPHLQTRVAGLVLDHARDKKVVLRHGGRARGTMRLRGLVTLVAAALVVVLIGGLVLSGRIWRDLHIQPQTINQAELKKLESRHLQLPVVPPGATCPTSALTDVSGHSGEFLVFGVGPVYLSPTAGSPERTSWGIWTALGLILDTKASGPILIRAQDLQTGEPVVFARYPLHAVDDPGDGIPTGRVLGSQVLTGETEQFYPELVIDTSRAWPGTRKGDWPIYKGYMGYPNAATGCLGFQFDGPKFTEQVVVSA